jgi:DNA-directed RNA polymerase specialized sigma24 family protein
MLNEFVRREINYHLAAGDLKSDELTPEDVVDAVVLSAIEEYKKSPPDLALDRWLIMLAIKHIRSEVQRLQKEREEFVHLEEDIPGTPPEEYVITLGDETLDFFQSDEDLRLEDVVPDPSVPTPDKLAEGRESQSSPKKM